MSEVKTGKPAGRSNVRAARTSVRLQEAVNIQRSEFLRMCRARIKPEEVGLAGGLRRAHATGLRREDVAALSGVSVSWYTWLEQGRDMRVSDDVLERLSETFRLTADERTYLFSLVQQRVPRLHSDSDNEAPPDVVRMIKHVNMPAVAMNLRWDVLAWNALNSAIYRDYGTLPPGQRNLLEILMIKPVRHMTSRQLESTARRICARLRYDITRSPADPKLDQLVRRLSAESPLFSRIWNDQDFTVRAYGLHRFTHARFGPVSFEHNSFVPDGHPNIRVVTCIPEDAATRRAVAQLIAEME
jgi:transcriptional regulator with XRE-family HTH domain